MHGAGEGARCLGLLRERPEEVFPLEDLLCVGLYRPLDGVVGESVADVVGHDVPPGAHVSGAGFEQVLLADRGKRPAPVGEPREPERRSCREYGLCRARLDAERGADFG